MNKLFSSALLVVMLGVAGNGSAQQTLSLQGALTLDTGVADTRLDIDVSVRNHSFVVVPPSFTIIRPITSKRTARVVMPAGENSVSYTIDGIQVDPVDFSIEIRCQNCPLRVPTQYYSPQGNRLGLANEVFIDPEDFPPQLDIIAVTRAVIAGQIFWDDPDLATRDLTFAVDVVSALDPSVHFGATTVVLKDDSDAVPYRIVGLRRTTGGADFQVQLQCINCVGNARRLQVFIDSLSPTMNHDGIDFTVMDTPPIVLTPVLNLLIE